MNNFPSPTLAPNHVQRAVPTTGQTVAIDSGYRETTLIVEPAGTLAALTLTMPANPQNGDKVKLVFTAIVTTLTVSGGTLGIALAAATAGLKYDLVYHTGQAKWY